MLQGSAAGHASLAQALGVTRPRPRRLPARRGAIHQDHGVLVGHAVPEKKKLTRTRASVSLAVFEGTPSLCAFKGNQRETTVLVVP